MIGSEEKKLPFVRIHLKDSTELSIKNVFDVVERDKRLIVHTSETKADGTIVYAEYTFPMENVLYYVYSIGGEK